MAKQQRPLPKSPAPAQSKVQPAKVPPAKTKTEGFFNKMPLAYKLCIALAVITIALNLNTLLNGFVMDDIMVVTDNTIVKKGFAGIGKLLTTPHMRGYIKLGNDTYRPLSLVFFAIENGIFGPDHPWVGHLVNVLFYAGCVVALFLFLNSLFDGKKTALAFVAALLFAVHPIHTEVVANIKSSDEILCFFFAFLALNLFNRYMTTGAWQNLAAGIFSLFLSFISKESAITLPAVIALTYFLYIRKDTTRAMVITASSVLVALTFLFIRHSVLQAYQANISNGINFIDNSLAKSGLPRTERLATAVLILGDYLKLLVIPYPLICDHSYSSIPFTGFGNPLVLLSGVVYLGMLVAAVFLLLKNKRDVWAWGILFFLITISLFSNIFILIGSTMADRFMFFPSVGICVLMAAAADKWLLGNGAETASWPGNKRLWMVILPLVLIYGSITYSRNEDWKDNVTLYKADIGKDPENTRLNYYYGCSLQKQYPDETDPVVKKQIIDDCKAHLKKSLEIYPSNSDSHEELGVAYFRVNEYDSAMPEFYTALRLSPKKVNASANLGTIYMNRKVYDSAIKYYDMTVKHDPSHALAYFNLAVCYSQILKYDSAIVDFRRAIDIAPDFDEYKAFQYTAILYKTIGRQDSAAYYEKLARQYNPKLQF